MNDPGVNALLRDVSRSVYLTLRALPAPVRSQIGLAYLLARATDTVADTELIPIDQRLRALQAMRERIQDPSRAPFSFGEFAQSQGSGAERILLQRWDEVIALLAQTTAEDRARIDRVLEIIIGGQELDLQRFGGAKAEAIVALEADDELDDYTYRVAGCVGEFWTDMCLAHLFRLDAARETDLRRDGVRFGKGLQLVNVLRDLPSDLRIGRCYLPRPCLAETGLRPADLLRAETMAKFRPLYDRYLDLAEAHLRAGWNYTNALPWSQARLRLGCSWLILIGFGTLRRLRAGNVLDAAHRIKVTRHEVYAMQLRSLLLYPFPALWRRQVDNAKTS